jgi:hypothetical protein
MPRRWYGSPDRGVMRGQVQTLIWEEASPTKEAFLPLKMSS